MLAIGAKEADDQHRTQTIHTTDKIMPHRTTAINKRIIMPKIPTVNIHLHLYHLSEDQSPRKLAHLAATIHMPLNQPNKKLTLFRILIQYPKRH